MATRRRRRQRRQPPAALRRRRRPGGQRAAAPRRGRRGPARRAAQAAAYLERALKERAPATTAAPAGRARRGRLRRRPARRARACTRPWRAARPRQPPRRADPAGGAERRRPRRAAAGALRAGAGLRDRSATRLRSRSPRSTRWSRCRRAAPSACAGWPRSSRRHADPALRRTPGPPRVGGDRARRRRAAAVAALAREALEGDELLRDAGRRAATTWRARARADRPRRGGGRGDRAPARAAVERGSLRLRAAAAWYAAELALRRGGLAEAEDEARWRWPSSTPTSACSRARGSRARGCWPSAARSTRPRRLRERGRRPLEGMPWQSAGIHARARLWLAEGDYERALAEASPAGRCARRAGARTRPGRPGARPRRWRSRILGAARRLSLWPPRSSRGPSASARRCRSPRRCTRAPSPSPTPRAGRRSASARWPWPPGRPRCSRRCARGSCSAARCAHWAGASRRGTPCAPRWRTPTRVGASLLAQRARRELVATGLRPRQAATEGAAALTPRQRQVCELAAAGKGNREIAQALFLSIKTVETHLAAGYRKLGVGTRAEPRRPAGALAADDPPVAVRTREDARDERRAVAQERDGAGGGHPPARGELRGGHAGAPGPHRGRQPAAQRDHHPRRRAGPARGRGGRCRARARRGTRARCTACRSPSRISRTPKASARPTARRSTATTCPTAAR